MPAYETRINTNANKRLDDFPSEIQDRLLSTVADIATHRQPTEHPDCEHFEGYDLLKVRVDRYRALLHFHKPYLDVVLVGHRNRVYDRLDVAEERAAI